MCVSSQESERKSYNPKSFCKMYIMDNQPLNTGEQKDMTEFFTDLITKIEEMSPELVSTSPCWLLTCGMCPLPSQLKDASVVQILINTCMVQFLILAGVSQSIVNASVKQFTVIRSVMHIQIIIIRIMDTWKAPILRLKALNKHTHIMYIEMENAIQKKQNKRY